MSKPTIGPALNALTDDLGQLCWKEGEDQWSTLPALLLGRIFRAGFYKRLWSGLLNGMVKSTEAAG